MTKPDPAPEWRRDMHEQAARNQQATSADAIAEMAGIPTWLLFKVVAADLAKTVREKSTQPKPARYVDVVDAAIEYAVQFTREDGFDRVWKPRRREYLKNCIEEFEG